MRHWGSFWLFYSPGFLWHRRRHRHHGHVYVVLQVDDCVTILLKPNEEIFLMTDNTIGGKGVDIRVRFLDAGGNEVVATADSPPTWTNNAAFETLTVSADGLSAHATAVAAGADTISVTAVVSGTSFSASVVVDVKAAPVVVASIDLVVTPTP